VQGIYNLKEVRDPALCSWRIERCWQGSLSGDLVGAYNFVFTSLTTPEPNDPNLFDYTGTSIIALNEPSQPQLFSQDTGSLRINPLGPTPFQTTATNRRGHPPVQARVGAVDVGRRARRA